VAKDIQNAYDIVRSSCSDQDWLDKKQLAKVIHSKASARSTILYKMHKQKIQNAKEFLASQPLLKSVQEELLSIKSDIE
jgi:hypothetical protein